MESDWQPVPLIVPFAYGIWVHRMNGYVLNNGLYVLCYHLTAIVPAIIRRASCECCALTLMFSNCFHAGSYCFHLETRLVTSRIWASDRILF